MKSTKGFLGKKLGKIIAIDLKEHAESIIKMCDKNKLLVELFLEHGIDKKIIKQNVNSLVDIALKGDVLVHCFLPSYFQGAPQDQEELFYDFLKYSANYYQKLYYENALECSVVIFIPSLEYFKQVCTQELDSSESVEKVLHNELLIKLPESCIYAFINQNKEQNASLCQKLSKGVPSKIVDVPLNLQYGLKALTAFTPYVLNKEKIYASKEAELRSRCLVNEDVHEKIMQLVKKEMYETNK